MNILLTGSSGFIGTHLAKLLKSHKVVPYDLKIGLDVRNEKQLIEKIKGCEVVVHLAAFTSVPKSWDNPTEYYDNNVLGTSKVVEASIKAGVKRLIFASSSAIYGAKENPYAASKAMGEGVLQVRKEMQTISLRFFNVYGKGQNPDNNMVIPTFIKGIKEGKISIYGDGEQTRDFIHVSDVCEVLKMAVEADVAPNFPRFVALDLGTSKSYSVNELAYLMMGLMEKQAEIQYLPGRKEIKHSLADPKILREVFKYQPKVTLVNGLKQFLKEGL